jgi:hypothetical protein
MDQGNRQQQVGRDEADHFLDARKEEKRRRIEHILVADEAARKRASDPFIVEGDRVKLRRLPDDPVVEQRIDWMQTEDDRHGPNIYKDATPLMSSLLVFDRVFIDWKYSQSCWYFRPIL